MSARAPRLQILAVGRLRPPHEAAGRLYEGRIAERLPLRVDEVSAEPLGRDAGRVTRLEADRLRARLVPRAHRVALDPRGRAPRSSDALAEWLAPLVEGPRPPAFLIGGPLGLASDLLGECEERLSLGPLTLPHQLARVVLAEQLYRALLLLAGHPYPR